MQVRRGSAASWTSDNPVLHQGEWGLETDTGKTKIGDGTTAWASLSYFAAANLSGGATLPAYLAPKVVTLAQLGGSVAVNMALGNVFRLVLTASGWTLANPTGFQDGEAIRVRLIQDSTGGRTVSYGSAWNFGAAGTPVLSTPAGKEDCLVGEWSADANNGAGAACVTLGKGF